MANALSYSPDSKVKAGTPGETSVPPELFDYGIHNEASNIRAHVAVLARVLYVFPTAPMLRILNDFPKRTGFQPGIIGPTSEGRVVPPGKIPYLRRLAISETRLDGFLETLSTSEKGDRAVGIVASFLKAGRFPLWLEGEFVDDANIQITGTDMIVKARWKIEVKCDFRASDQWREPHERCTGNLFLQTAERNPKKLH